MGGGGSKQLSDIDAVLDVQFKANCNTSAQSIQAITLEGVNIIASDNCQISFMNKASVNSTCDMGPIIDAISEMAVSADKDFAETLQDAQDRQANSKCEADNCVDKVKVAVRRRLTEACESKAKAQQTMKLTGARIFCDGNTVATFGNFSEVRATCLRSLLHGGIEEVSSKNTSDISSKNTSDDESTSSLGSNMMIMGILFLFALFFLT